MLRFVLNGPPRTKKNTGRIVPLPSTRGGGWLFAFRGGPARAAVPMLLPSEAFENWFAAAMHSALLVKTFAHRNGISLPIDGPVWVKALFYQDADRHGDLVGYEQALGDWLQAPVVKEVKGQFKQTRDGAGIIHDDVQIASWDGSRVYVDKENPRIEVEVRRFVEGQARMEF